MALIQYLSRIEFDFGAVSQVRDIIADLGLHRPLLVSDRGIAECGILERVLDAARPVRPELYLETPENPTEASLREAMLIWNAGGCDGVIALGGGSPIDLAKAVALLASHGGAFQDYCVGDGGSTGIGKVAPQIAIPTAAGTGAEVGRACVLTLDDGWKAVAVNLNLVADRVICDPELTMSLPPILTAATGLDALSHGIETTLSPTENPPAEAIALDCIARAATWLPRAVENGQDRKARREMMMAALEGGMCLQKGLGGAHAMATPLGSAGHHHGTLIGILLPAILEFNRDAAAEKIARAGAAAGLAAGEDLGRWVEKLVARIGLPGRLSQLGISGSELPQCAELAERDHLSATNPRRASAADYLKLMLDVL